MTTRQQLTEAFEKWKPINGYNCMSLDDVALSAWQSALSAMLPLIQQEIVERLWELKIDTEHSHGHVEHNHALDEAIAVVQQVGKDLK